MASNNTTKMVIPASVKKARATDELGVTGTYLHDGFISNTDYNSEFEGPDRIDKYMRMRNDDTINSSIEAITQPMINAKWYIEGGEESHQQFVEANMEGLQRSWSDFIREAALSFVYGVYPFEIIYKIGDKGEVLWKDFRPRMPDTITEWHVDDGELEYIVQGDAFSMDRQPEPIPAWKLMVFLQGKEGDNFEGRSMIRPAWKAYYAKDSLIKLALVADERMSLGIPHVHTSDNADPASVTNAENFAKYQRNTEYSYIRTKGDPEAIQVGFLDTGANTSKNLLPDIEFFDRQLAKGLFTQFLGLGSNGSFALAKIHKQVLEKKIGGLASNLIGVIQKQAINRLLDLNFPGIKEYPELKVDSLHKDDVNELSQVLQRLSQAGLLTNTPKTEEHLRKKVGLPEEDMEEIYREKEEKFMKIKDQKPNTPTKKDNGGVQSNKNKEEKDEDKKVVEGVKDVKASENELIEPRLIEIDKILNEINEEG